MARLIWRTYCPACRVGIGRWDEPTFLVATIPATVTLQRGKPSPGAPLGSFDILPFDCPGKCGNRIGGKVHVEQGLRDEMGISLDVSTLTGVEVEIING